MLEYDTSSPPSNMDFEDLLAMATSDPDNEAANLPTVSGKGSIAASTTTLFVNEVKMNYNLSLEKRVGFLLDKKLYTDVTFVVGEDPREFTAHKLILATASPVFASMFFSAMASLSVIEIPDCLPDAFQALLQYAYKSEVSGLRTEIAPEILYVARKYAVKGLEDACLIHMSSNITNENVFDILECTKMYDLSALEADCWAFIEEHPKQVLNFHLERLELDMLLIILKNDRLKIVETDLFEIVLQWTDYECFQQNLESTIDNKHLVGGKALKLIRFTTMNPSSFVEKVVPTSILSVDEIARILIYVNASLGNKPEIEFNTQKRSPKQVESAKVTESQKGVFQFVSDSEERNIGNPMRRRHRARRYLP